MSEVGLVLILAFVALLVLGVPIYLALGFSALATIVVFDLLPLTAVPGTIRSSLNSFTLLAIPFFILAGNLLAGSQIAVRLIELARAFVGAIRGGLAVVSVWVGVFFAGISGSGPADVGAQGAVLIPALERDGYPRPFASALVAANGAIGIIVPPSIGLIVYGVVANVSIGRLFIAGIIPGVVVAISFALVSVFLARRHGWGPVPAIAGGAGDQPPVDVEGARVEPEDFRLVHLSAKERVGALFTAARRAGWGILAPLIILGGIYGGIFTPTEAAAVVVVYALFVGMVVYRDIKIRDLPRIFVSSARMSGVVMIIVASASLYAFILNTEGIARDFATFLTSIAPNALVLLLMINLVILLAGTLLDAVSIYYIFVPILLPVAAAIGVDPVHFGLILTVNLALGQVTPPVGVNLFVGASVGEVSIAEISKAVLPILVAGIIALLVITFVPGLTLWLPDLLGA